MNFKTPLQLLSCLSNRQQCRLHSSQQIPPTPKPLSQTYERRLKVCKISGDRKLCARMATLGLLPGCEIELLCPSRGHRCMVKVNGGTLSLDQPCAENIMVLPA